MTKANDMLISIVICTYNRADFLQNCLQQILPQLLQQPEVEILVINNNSTDNTSAVCATFTERYSQVRVLFCKEQGLSYARNYALSHAQGQWIGYLDDDAYPAPDWFEQALRLISSDEYDAFGGVYYPWYKDGKKSWFSDSFETNASWIEVKDEGRLRSSYFSGGNGFFKVSWLNYVGGFPTELGMNGKAMGYGEETYVQRLMALRGAILGFSHKLIIYHYTPLHKQSVVWSWRKHYAYGKSFWKIYQKPAVFRQLSFYCKNEIKATALSLKYASSQRQAITSKVYLAMRFARVFGLIRGYLEAK